MAKYSESGNKHAAKSIPPILVVFGEDRFSQQLHIDALRQKMLAAHGQVQTCIFTPGDCAMADVLDELRSMGLMMQAKLVILEDADVFLKDSDDRPDAPTKRGASKSNRELLEGYCQNPSDVSVLVLRASKWNKGKLDEKITEAGGTFEACSEPTDADATRWLIKRASKYDASISAEAANVLVANIGPDLGRLDCELAKLATASLARQAAGKATEQSTTPFGKIEIPLELIYQMTAFNRQEALWTIQNHILSGDYQIALRAFRDAIDIARESPHGILAAYVDLARKVDGMTRALAAKENPASASGRLRMWGPSANAITNIARKLSPTITAKLLSRTVLDDARCKSGRGKPESIAEAMTIEFVRVIRNEHHAEPFA